MKKNGNLFEEFPAVTSEEWLARANKDLRGKPFNDLNWHLEETIKIAPFYHPDEMDDKVMPLLRSGHNQSWEIGQLIDVDEIQKTNETLLDNLAHGVEAPLLILHQEWSDEAFSQLFKEVRPDFISTHFTLPFSGKQPGKLLQQFQRLLHQQQLPLQMIKGSIDYDPILDWSHPPYDDLAMNIRFCEKKMPLFRPLQVNGLRFHSGVENTSQELAMILAKGSEYLAQLNERGLSPDLVNRHMQFTLSLSTSYFVEIAKLRAFRILWANVLHAHNAANEPCIIVAHLAGETQVADQYDNMIKAGTQAMSAVIGGADRLYIRPADFPQQQSSSAFTLRIARNVQHLLRMESHLGQVADPGAGSYYIEKLTDNLVDQAWKGFQELEAKRAFG